jgi:hypothetical protein
MTSCEGYCLKTAIKLVIYSNQQYKWQDIKHPNQTKFSAFLGHSNLVQTMWLYHMVQLDCYKTRKKQLLLNAKIFAANLGGKFWDICYINPTLIHFW